MQKSEPKRLKLRTIEDLNTVSELTLNNFLDGKIDSKAVDGVNTIVKNQIYLNVKLRMDFMKICLQAGIKKINLPVGVLPELAVFWPVSPANEK